MIAPLVLHERKTLNSHQKRLLYMTYINMARDRNLPCPAKPGTSHPMDGLKFLFSRPNPTPSILSPASETPFFPSPPLPWGYS